jgi:DNA-binding transcriptional MerR regulator
VDELSALELIGRAGVLPEDVERLVQLGIFAPRAGERPFTPGDVRRVRLASACAETGLPLEGIGAAMAAGKLIPAVLDHPLFRWSGRTAETYRDLAARLGLRMALLRRGYEAAGFAPPEPDELVREDGLDLIPTIQAAVAAGIDEDATVRALRVFGDSLRLIAETQNRQCCVAPDPGHAEDATSAWIRWPWSTRRTQSPHADSPASQRPARSVRAERSG